MVKVIADVTLTLREGEELVWSNTEPHGGLWFAAKLVPCNFPDSDYHQYTGDGKQVSQSVLATCRRCEDGLWHWQPLSQNMKDILFDHLLDTDGLALNVWYYYQIRDKEQHHVPQQ